MPSVILLQFVVGAALLALGPRIGRWVFAVAAVPFAVGCGVLVASAGDVWDERAWTWSASWVPSLGLSLDFRLDALGWLMCALIFGVGVLVHLYSLSYFGAGKPGLHRIAGLLTIFGGAMAGLVTADHLLAVFLFWELTSITSYLLIGNDDRSAVARGAALQALLTTAMGGLALFAGLLLIGVAGGTWRISELVNAPSGTMVGAGLALVLLGAATKSAQFPFSFWLPGAMAAPTPVSAYLHSATMVKAGVYLIARFAPPFADTIAWWRPVVVTIGLITMLTGGVRALRQRDLKLLLAHGTVSQLGFLTLLFGWGHPAGTTAGAAVLLAHGLFKSALFLTVGIVDHQFHTRDLRKLHWAGRPWIPTAVVGTVAAASMAGLPPVLGFIAKEYAYEAGIEHSWLVTAFVIVGSVFTLAYSTRFVWALLGGAAKVGGEPAPDAPAKAPTRAFLAPAALPALLTAIFGLVPFVLDRPLTAAVRAAGVTIKPLHLALWHGINTALLLSLLTIALGVVVFLTIGRGLGTPTSWTFTGAEGFTAVVKGANVMAARIIGVIQNGSLPAYLTVITLVAFGLPSVMALQGGGLPPLDDWRFGTGLDATAAAILIGGGLAVALTRRRFAAALALGAVGYGMALVFLLEGAPDLALTQLTIETLSTILFVLVFRALPARFPRESTTSWLPLRIGRLAVSGAMGVFVFLGIMYSTESRTDVPVSGEYLQRSLPEAGGRNVVNVILVDFRGFDTLGELTVLVVAAIGAATLALNIKRGRVGEAPEGSPASALGARDGEEVPS